MAEHNAPSCVAQVGLLVLHKCGRRAVGRCDSCGLPFCKKHLVEVEENGRMCPSCVEKEGATPTQSSDAVERQRRRRAYYRDYDYYPYYYHDRYYYWDDYEIVERRESDVDSGTSLQDAAPEEYDFTES